MMDFTLCFTFFILPTIYFFFQFLILENEKQKFLKELEIYELEYISFQENNSDIFPDTKDPNYGKMALWIYQTMEKFEKRQSIFLSRGMCIRWEEFCFKNQIPLPQRKLERIFESPFQENDDDCLIFYF